MQHFLWKDHLAWNLVLPMDCVKNNADDKLPKHCSEGFGAINPHRKYWNMIRKKHYAPYCRSSSNGECDGAPPLIVIPHSFVWDQPTFLVILKALFEQPQGFIQRIVIASIESNFKPLSGTSDEPLLPLHDRIRPSCTMPNYPSNLGSTHQKATPLFVTLPYPTGLSVTSHVSFAPNEEESVSANQEGVYNPNNLRPLTILLDANLDRKGGGGKITQCWIRPLLHSKLMSAGGTCQGTVCSLCHEKYQDQTLNSNSVISCDSNWPLNTHNAKLWELMVSSTFCLEPAGDTMTRSHFYASVISGCIPVLFDGGVADFHEEDETCWAWRGNGEGSTLKYSDFAVIYNSSSVRDGSVDVIKELSEMSTVSPERFLSLRRGVDRAAAKMRYASTEYSDSPDAFSTFIEFLQYSKTSLDSEFIHRRK